MNNNASKINNNFGEDINTSLKENPNNVGLKNENIERKNKQEIQINDNIKVENEKMGNTAEGQNNLEIKMEKDEMSKLHENENQNANADNTGIVLSSSNPGMS